MRVSTHRTVYIFVSKLPVFNFQLKHCKGHLLLQNILVSETSNNSFFNKGYIVFNFSYFIQLEKRYKGNISNIFLLFCNMFRIFWQHQNLLQSTRIALFLLSECFVRFIFQNKIPLLWFSVIISQHQRGSLKIWILYSLKIAKAIF